MPIHTTKATPTEIGLALQRGQINPAEARMALEIYYLEQGSGLEEAKRLAVDTEFSPGPVVEPSFYEGPYRVRPGSGFPMGGGDVTGGLPAGPTTGSTGGGGTGGGGTGGQFGGGTGGGGTIDLDPFTEQEASRRHDVFRRYMQTSGIGDTSPLLRAGIERQFSNLHNRYFIRGLGTPEGAGAPGTFGTGTFERFLGGDRATPDELRTNLNYIRDILGGGGGSPGQIESIQGRYGGEPEYEAMSDPSFGAVIQPLLAQMAPAFRAAFVTGAARAFDQNRATNPGESFFDYARRIGFF